MENHQETGPGAERFPEEPLVRELGEPTSRTLTDFPIGTEVVAFVNFHGNLELREAMVAEHTAGGQVKMELKTANRGVSSVPMRVHRELDRNRGYVLRPDSPGLLLPDEVEVLQAHPERIPGWVANGGTYVDRDRKRLAQKIRDYNGFEGRPYGSTGGDAVPGRGKGIRIAGRRK